MDHSCYRKIAVINKAHHVHLVQHNDTKKIYVMKCLDIYNRQVYEMLFSRKINGIAQIIDLWEEDDQLYVIEEYISGKSLKEMIEEHTLTKEDIVKYVMELCDIVNCLHTGSFPIIHRDIKPSNIIVTGSEHVVLLDFNAAKVFTDENETDTVLLGTHGYAAPEQYGFGYSSEQTDIYAIGILMKEMKDSLIKPTKYFDRVIAGCTKIKPNERYESIEQLSKDLKNMSNGMLPKNSIDRYNSFKPVGFRSGNMVNMTIATIGYLLVLILVLTPGIEDKQGIALVVDRLFYFTLFISFIMIIGNYRNVQSVLSLSVRSHLITRIIGVLCLCIVAVLLLTFVLTVLQMIFPVLQ